MPTITTRGNVTATAYGFGKVGGGALGSYYLVTINNNSNSQASIAGISKVTNSNLFFSCYNNTIPQNFYGVLTNTGTLNWSNSLNSPNSTSSGVCAYDGTSKVYVMGRNSIESGYFNESTGAWTNISQTSSTGLYYNDNFLSILPVGSYIYANSRCYDPSFTNSGFGGALEPIAGGNGSWRNRYYTTSDWAVATSAITASSSSTANGIVGGKYGSTSVGPIYVKLSYSGSGSIITTAYYIQNSNSAYISSADTVIAAVMDSSGNQYVMAVFLYDSAGNYGAFRSIYKINSSGTVIWARKLSNGEFNAGRAVLDSLGNVYFCIDTSDSILITKYTTSGTFVWDRKLATGTTYSLPPVLQTDDASFWAGTSISGSKSVIIRAPADGTKTGTYGGYVYSVNQTSDTAFTGYTFGTPSSTFSATTTLSASTPSITASSYSPTIVKTTV